MHPRLPILLFLFTILTASYPVAAASFAASPRPGQLPASRLAPPLPRSYAALGASETYGVGAQPHTSGYAYLVARALGANPFVDEGIPGTTLNAGYQTELTSALQIRPSLATVFFGFNDVTGGVPRAAFLRDLRDLVVTLRRAGARVLIIGFPDLALLPVARRYPQAAAIVASWNSGMAGVARTTGAHFLNLTVFSAELAAHRNYISSDGLHPSNAGHAALARTVVQAIRKEGLWPAR